MHVEVVCESSYTPKSPCQVGPGTLESIDHSKVWDDQQQYEGITKRAAAKICCQRVLVELQAGLPGASLPQSFH